MEAKELMIGDWMYIKDYPMRQEAKKMRAEHYQRSLCEFEPIPLTEEILTANGFLNLHSDFQRKYNAWFEDMLAFIEYNFSEKSKLYNRLVIVVNKIQVINIHIEYVHEFQHALRLCGLNDVADNFKIE